MGNRDADEFGRRFLLIVEMRTTNGILFSSLIAAACIRADAQVFVPVDTPAELTPTGEFLVTREVNLTSGVADGPPGRAKFELGFSTSESAGPGLHDSLTATLTSLSDTPIAVIATIDLSGITLAPTTPGGLAVNAGGITLTPVVARFASVPGATFSVAYSIDLAIPAGLDGSSLKLIVDFIDVGDPGGSKGSLFVPASVAVPEVESWWLMGALPAWACWGRRRKSQAPTRS